MQGKPPEGPPASLGSLAMSSIPTGSVSPSIQAPSSVHSLGRRLSAPSDSSSTIVVNEEKSLRESEKDKSPKRNFLNRLGDLISRRRPEKSSESLNTTPTKVSQDKIFVGASPERTP